MTDRNMLFEAPERAEPTGAGRRNFIRLAGGAAAMAGGLSLLSACGGDNDGAATPSPTPTATVGVTDTDVLSFALQLGYLELSYYFLALGIPLTPASYTGLGVLGTLTGGAAVTFTDTPLREQAYEIAFDISAHVTFLRATLSSAASAFPPINIAGDATGAFTQAARAAGVVGPSDVFNPYASENNFLTGAYLLSDVAVSAYRGSAKLITNKTYLEAAAGILATRAYHDGVIRSSLYARGLATPSLFTTIQQISDARDGLDGADDLDQSIGDATTANIVPTDANGLVLGRSAAQVLNIVYLNKAAVKSGGFFPSGLNGGIFTSAANG